MHGGSTADPPKALVMASRLWVAAGVVVLVFSGLLVLSGLGDSQYMPLAVLFVGGLFVALGSSFVSLGRGLRRGADHRVVLIVLTVPSALLLLPPLLAIPAIWLQYRRESREWLDRHRPISPVSEPQTGSTPTKRWPWDDDSPPT